MSILSDIKYKLFPTYFYKRDLKKGLLQLKKIVTSAQIGIYKDAVEVKLFKDVKPTPWYQKSQSDMLKAMKGVSLAGIKGGLSSINLIYHAMTKLPDILTEMETYAEKELDETMSKELLDYRLTMFLVTVNNLAFFINYSQLYLLRAYGDMYAELRDQNPDIPAPLAKAEEIYLEEKASAFFSVLKFILSSKDKIIRIFSMVDDKRISNNVDENTLNEIEMAQQFDRNGIDPLTIGLAGAAISGGITLVYAAMGLVGVAKAARNTMVINSYERNKLVVEALTLRAEQLRLEIAKTPNPELSLQLEKVESERIKHEKKIHDTEVKFGLADDA